MNANLLSNRLVHVVVFKTSPTPDEIIEVLRSATHNFVQIHCKESVQVQEFKRLNASSQGWVSVDHE
jgi:phosphoribosylanthranilate isomerase